MNTQNSQSGQSGQTYKWLTCRIGSMEHRMTRDTVLHAEADTPVVFDIAGAGCAYGYGFNHNQPYPLNESQIVNEKFEVNNIQSPIWLLSGGYILLAETNDSLSVSLNKGGSNKLIIRSVRSAFDIKVFCDVSLTAAHERFLSYIGARRQNPGSGFVGDSVFCTWTQFPRCISRDNTLFFAEEIRRNGYPCSIITIDDRWEKKYGDLSFSSDFENPDDMVRRLHSLGFKVVLWVTPFISVDSDSFQELSDKRYLVWHRTQNRPALFTWWGGEAALVDLTNPQAARWYETKLRHLQETCGVDGFKIDGGDAKYQPSFEDSQWYRYQGASGYLDVLLSIFEKIAPGMCESRTAWMSQKRNIVWRQGGKDSVWGADNGLRAIVSLGLNLSLMGYDFLMPDMVGGRIQTMSTDDPIPTDELFMRFTECSAFFPALQFSYFPWNYGTAVQQGALTYAKVHKALEWYVRELLADGQSPLLRPVWYGNETEDETLMDALYRVKDQYMLGKDLLVAPVLDPGIIRRDVLLPGGSWILATTGECYEGGALYSVPAPCPGIPVFVRKGDALLLKSVTEEISHLDRGSIRPDTTTSDYQAGINRTIKVTG